MVDQLIQLFKYNKEANDRYIQALQGSVEINERALELMSHILNAQEVWFDRFDPIPEKKSVMPWDKRELNTLKEDNARLYTRAESFIKKNSAEISSTRVIYYKTTKGQDFENNLIDILYHIINHASYHRGQISIYLREKEITPPNSDYIMFVRE